MQWFSFRINIKKSQSGFQLFRVYVSYLTSADLTGVVSWMEAVTWAVHSALEYTVCSRTIKEDHQATWKNWEKNSWFVLFWIVTSTHGAALPGHADEVDAGRQTAYFRARGHPVHTHAGHAGGGVCKPAAALGMLLSSVHTTWGEKIQSLVKLFPPCDSSFQWCVYLCSEDSRLQDQSPDAYKAAWGTREAHNEPHLPVRLREISAQKQGKELIWREKTNGGVRPGKCRWSRGLNSGSMSARRWTPVHRAYILMTRWQGFYACFFRNH